MHAAVRDEAEEVRPLAALERRLQHGILEERAVLDRLVHAHEVLEEDAPGADRQMTNLRVPHPAVRKSDRLARRGEPGVRIGAPEPIEVRRVGELDGVAGARRRTTPAVEDDERYERIAARQ